MTEIGDRLRSARELAGLSQGQVAKILGMHRPTVSEIEAGRRKVTAEEVGEFARIYEVGIDWILGQASDTNDPARVQLAARELSKLSSADLERVLRLLQTLRDSEAIDR